MSELAPVIIGTAGHVDHGKTCLIRALTGVETDRLRQEQERGISIELGFAPLRLPSGRMAGIVDVPGHERFIHNMLAGVGGIDLVLLVVDVGEGVMPQTKEHLQILDLLKIPRGIVVLTKCDLAEDDDWLDLVEEEIREELSGTFLEEAPVCRVSATTGTGLKELMATMEAVLQTLPAHDIDGPARLPVDRHFSVAGFGTVVTGTLLSGEIKTGDLLQILPVATTVRIREIQVHGKKSESAKAGQRVALNLANLDRGRIERGCVVGTPGIFEQTTRFDARLTLLPTAPRPLKFRDPVHLYLGTARVVGLIALLDRDQLEPGESALVQIHLDRPLVAHRQDRFIIRSYSPMTTIGGGQIIDPRPIKHRRFRDEVMQALADLESGEQAFLLQKIGELTTPRFKELEQASGLGRERIQDHLDRLVAEGAIFLLGDQWINSGTLRFWQHTLVTRVGDYHIDNPLLSGIPLATLKGVFPKSLSQKGFDGLLEQAINAQKIVVQSDSAALPGFRPQPTPQQQRVIDAIEQAYCKAGPLAKNRTEMLEPLHLNEAEATAAFGYLFTTGKLVRLNDENYFHQETYTQAVALLRDRFSDKEFTLAEFRDSLGSARKAVQALLEQFDAIKYTLRKGDVRVVWKLPDKL
ncbi:MAG: selenocysteine-specific translation elongation factor [Desulfuromonadales bacterium]|nr:selenocysteine-specific translation elongation factor [Desulfuromonadales bacterium]